MASITKRVTQDGIVRWWVRWRDITVTVDINGKPTTHEKNRSRTFGSQREAQRFKREVESMTERGENWTPPREEAVGNIRIAALAWVEASINAGAPTATTRHRSAMIGSFLDWIGAGTEDGPGVSRPISELSLELLDAYATHLPSDGRKAATRHRKLLAVEQMWRWAYDRRGRFPGCPLPERLTGNSRDADRISAPPPVVALAAPSWGDVDGMIGQLNIEWHRRAALIMRFHGARASQVCGLSWSDIDLERGILYWRSHVTGAKSGRARVVPIHPWLRAEMAGWGTRDGLLFPRRYRDPATGEQRPGAYRGDALVEPFRRAWLAAGVPSEKWDIPEQGERGKGSPTHALRRCLRTELIRAGVEEAVVLYLVGQSQGLTAAAYVPEQSPEQSPYWPRLIDALTSIPEPGRVRSLSPAAGRGSKTGG